MKNIFKIFMMLGVAVFLSTCTSDFDKINSDPVGFTKEEISAKYFLTRPQFLLYAPNRFSYWRAHLIHADRYAGHFCFGFSGSDWSDELAYTYHGAYTDAVWGWLSGYIGDLQSFMTEVKPGGLLENRYMYAVGLVMKGLYYQKYTDVFGMVPYSEAGNPEILLPKYDEQKTIYKGIISQLDTAMSIIGSETTSGTKGSVFDLADNDIYYKGDLQQWKKLANTLKLRIAMRALGAEDDDFASKVVNEALASPLLEQENDNCLLPKDEAQSQWNSAAYGDIWHNFGLTSNWTVSKPLIDVLRDNNDPRLKKYAKPAIGDTITLQIPGEWDKATAGERVLHNKRVDFILKTLDTANVVYTTLDPDPGVKKVIMAKDSYYVGQPVRINSTTQNYVAYALFSTPSDRVIRDRSEGDLYDEIVLSVAEAYFLRAEAAVRGLSGENAQSMFTKGIEHAMKLWDVDETDIATYTNSPIAKLTGGMDDKIKQIAIQRWIAAYTDGFEAWAIVRDYKVPAKLYKGVTDFDLFGPGTISGRYPQRLRYGNNAYNTNAPGVTGANASQGADKQDTKLWWAK